MYKEIEKIYKEKSEFNIITRIIFKVYWCIILFTWLFGIKYSTWLALIITVIIVILMISLVSIRLKIRIVFNDKNKKHELHSLKYFIYEQEYNLIRNHVIKNNMYNIEVIKNIINHYRSLIPISIKGGNFIAILTLVITILLSIIDENGLKENVINQIIPYVIMFLIIYASYKLINHYTKTIKGEEGMYEKLEEIFSDLLVEVSSKENNITKTSNQKRKTKHKKTN